MKIPIHRTFAKIVILLAVFFLLPSFSLAQGIHVTDFNRDTLLTAAKDIIAETRYCALITLDTGGHPQARTMDPFPPQDDMVIWLGTNPQSRKVREICNDPRVTLYYEAPNGGGYVVIKGQAHIIDNAEMKLKYWKTEWEQFYPDNKDNYILIKVVPQKLEIIDYRHDIMGESDTWAVPSIEFNSGQ
jgi:general stress protein 26